MPADSIVVLDGMDDQEDVALSVAHDTSVQRMGCGTAMLSTSVVAAYCCACESYLVQIASLLPALVHSFLTRRIS